MPLLDEIIQMFLQAAPYLLLGFFFSGVIQSFVPKEKVASWIGQNNFRSVFVAAAAGVPMSLCSCGVIPMAMSLRKSGASRGATLSFLIATPEIGLDSFMLSLALLDPVLAIFRPVAAFVTAMTAGIMENLLDHSKEEKKIEPPKDCCHEHPVPPRSSWLQRFKEGCYESFVVLLGDIAPWLILGLVLSGVISYMVPTTMIEKYLGGGIGSMLFMLVAGIPLYACAAASTPIAASLLLKGASPGTVLVLLLAGPATNATTILMIYKFLGKKAVIVYLLSVSICAIAAGVLLNSIYVKSGINIEHTIGQASHYVDMTWQMVSAVILVVLMGYALVRKYF